MLSPFSSCDKIISLHLAIKGLKHGRDQYNGFSSRSDSSWRCPGTSLLPGIARQQAHWRQIAALYLLSLPHCHGDIWICTASPIQHCWHRRGLLLLAMCTFWQRSKQDGQISGHIGTFRVCQQRDRLLP
jgi:hypothetical protein